jgi:hypothetical protein
LSDHDQQQAATVAIKATQVLLTATTNLAAYNSAQGHFYATNMGTAGLIGPLPHGAALYVPHVDPPPTLVPEARAQLRIPPGPGWQRPRGAKSDDLSDGNEWDDLPLLTAFPDRSGGSCERFVLASLTPQDIAVQSEDGRRLDTWDSVEVTVSASVSGAQWDGCNQGSGPLAIGPKTVHVLVGFRLVRFSVSSGDWFIAEASFGGLARDGRQNLYDTDTNPVW